MVRNTEEAVEAADNTHTNVVGTCQLVTRGWLDAPSAGDQDGDGDADAVDGWKSEPLWARHVGDRRPPRGMPVAFSGGRRGYGHRALSKGNGVIRSTDMSGGSYAPGHVGDTTIEAIERAMGVTYTGWSETIDGYKIPVADPPAGTLISRFLEGGPRYDLSLLDKAVDRGRTGVVQDVRDAIVHQVNRLPKDEQGTRVAKFLRAYKQERLLKLGLLNKAIADGRTGIVKDVRAKIMKQIHKLPPR